VVFGQGFVTGKEGEEDLLVNKKEEVWAVQLSRIERGGAEIVDVSTGGGEMA